MNPQEQAARKLTPYKFQARYDALSTWKKFLFRQNQREWTQAWEIESLESQLSQAQAELAEMKGIVQGLMEMVQGKTKPIEEIRAKGCS